MSGTAPVRVLYLAGSGRSGSTLVTTILGQLDGCFAAGELRYLWQRGVTENRPCGCGLPFVECPLWRAVLAEPALGLVDAPGMARLLRVRLRLRDLPALLCRHAAGRAALPEHPDDASIAALYPAIARHVPGGGDGAKTGGGPVVIVDSSKLPPYGALLGTLPGIDLRVLHLVRDPRGTAFSWRRRRQLDGAADDRLMSRPPVWKAALLWLVWNAATRRLWESGGSGRYLRIRYEDVVADPEPQIRRIAEFAGLAPAGLPFTADGQVRLAPTHSVAGNPARHRTGTVPISDDAEWTRAMPTWSYAVVTAITLPLLRRLGYPLRRPPAPAAVPDPAPAAVPASAATLAGAPAVPGPARSVLSEEG